MRFRRSAIVALILVTAAIVAVVAAGRLRRPPETAQPTDPARTTQPTQHPYWTLTAAGKRKLLEGASRLKAGDNYDQVIASLGKPSDDRQLIPKGSNLSHGRSLSYQALRWEDGLVNELFDEWVLIVLDTHDVVREVKIRLTVSE